MAERGRLTVTLTLVGAGDDGDAPAIIRLRRLLKECLRRWAFRCTRAVRDQGDRSGDGQDAGLDHGDVP